MDPNLKKNSVSDSDSDPTIRGDGKNVSIFCNYLKQKSNRVISKVRTSIISVLLHETTSVESESVSESEKTFLDPNPIPNAKNIFGPVTLLLYKQASTPWAPISYSGASTIIIYGMRICCP
jgi:hypothetical protein